MAVRCDALNEGIVRSAGAFLSGAADFSVMYKFRIFTDTPAAGNYRVPWILGDASYVGAYLGTFIYPGVVPEITTSNYPALENNTVSESDAGPVTLGRWYDILCIYDNTAKTLSFYIDGWLIGSVPVDLAAAVYAAERLGYDLTTDDHSNIEVEYYRSWQSKITLAEYTLERVSANAVKATPFCDTPLVSDLLDDSGNGRDWTANGSIEFVTGATLITGAPANISSILATAISEDETVFQNINSGGSTPTVWFSYTTVAGSRIINVFGLGQSSGYTPEVAVFEGPASSPVIIVAASDNLAVVSPVDGGTTYFFRFTPPAGNPSPAVLKVGITEGPSQQAVPAGSILIINDNSGLQSNAASSVDGELLRTVHPFATSESGDVLFSNGRILTADNNGGGLKLYDSDLIQLLAIAESIDTSPSAVGVIRTNPDIDKWYIAVLTASETIKTVDPNGIVSAVVALITGSGTVRTICPSLDETILYYDKSTGEIQRWDLVNDVALSALTSAQAGTVLDILALSDGTIVSGWLIPGPDVAVRRFDSSGTLLNTYGSWGVSGTLTSLRIAYALDDPTHFWAMFDAPNSALGNTSYKHFFKVRVSDGVFVTQFSVLMYSNGYAGDPTPTPQGYFGVPNSCPLLITHEGVPVENVSSGIYKIVPEKTNDTLYVTLDPVTTIDVKIP